MEASEDAPKGVEPNKELREWVVGLTDVSTKVVVEFADLECLPDDA